jgi:hypothetical protein
VARGSRCLASSCALSLLAIATDASAFCRTTTCDPKDESQVCVPNSSGCIEEGLPLIWPERCLHFGVQQNGSPRRGITWEDADLVIQQAFRQWISVSCDGQGPSFSVYDVGAPYGGIECDQPEFNQNAPNANVWMFRDDDWPYTGAASTLALTTLTFEVPTGDILDADVEINSFSIPITVGDQNIDNDLLSIATHEAGHFLGLSHSNIKSATMNANYSPGDIEFRTLHADDIEAICTVYPPDRDVPSCEKAGPQPRHGFTRFCASGLEVGQGNCAVARTPERGRESRGPTTLLMVTLVGLVAARYRRHH